MTDIQRHLKGIRKILANALEDSLDLAQIQADLRAFLPKSYGLGAGRLTDGENVSAPVQLLIYDGPLAAGAYAEDSTLFRVEHVLLIADIAVQHSTDTLRDSLEGIASVKRLRQARPREMRPAPPPPGQARRTIPKDRLPFALVYCKRLADYPPHAAGMFAALYDLMRTTPPGILPDQIDISMGQAQYLNPLLDNDQADISDLGWSRTPDCREPELCYVCKSKFFRRHFFYDWLCLRCGDLNYHKRVQSADLSGYRVLITGGRLKIGYASALRLLRAGAAVILTSRFPRDTARRYAQEPDFEVWRERLHIYGLDLRQIPRLEAFARHLDQTYPHLDAIINNAAQTVKRPPAFYAHLLPLELADPAELPAPLRPLLKDGIETDHLQAVRAGLLASGHDATFPPGAYDEHGQQIDNRDFNSWVMELEDVPPAELVEVHLVNAVAPALLAGQLKPLLLRSPHAARFIINVSAAEGRFDQSKNGRHPHTNMAKAALNMLTRSIAEAYARDRIYVTSVDPGWVSDQLPRPDNASRERARELPIDLVDAAARLCDPLFAGIQCTPPEKPIFGKLIKDYEVVSW